MIAGTACSFKSGIIVEIIFYIIAIVEMIAYNVSIFFYYEITTICIVTTFPFFCRCHSKSRIKK